MRDAVLTVDALSPVSDLLRFQTAAPEADHLAGYRRLVCHVLGVPAAHVSVAGTEEMDELMDGVAPAPHPLLRLGCEQALTRGEVLAIPDARRDPWLREQGYAVQLPDLVALLCVPVADPEGAPAACVCALDTEPRLWTEADVDALTEVALLVGREVLLRREVAGRRTLENLVRVLGKAVENMQLGVTVTDLEGRIIYTNPAEARMHGYEVADLVGQHARIFGPPELTRTMDVDALQGTTSWARETVNVRKDGSRFPVLLWSDRVSDADGRCIGFVTCSEDITERKRAEQALRDVALRDPLTGLANRSVFLDRLTQAIQAARHDPEARFAVLFLDLDRFKVVNDSLGHHVGDELLRVVAQRLESCLRPVDTVARFGGDEFAILLEQMHDSEHAIAVAERIQTTLRAAIHLDGYELFTSASIGIVLNSPMVEQPEYLWRSADMAMYRAKAGGTGRFEVFDRAMHADALAKLQLENDLRRAVERQEFRLHYQPVVALDTGCIVGFEALLRWEHPLQGMVPPAQIIPAAEETGLILPIGEWVLREACRQLGAWQAGMETESPLWMGVNLSSKQLNQVGLLAQVEDAIREAGIAASTLKLEITESAVVENTELAATTLQSLRSLGVQLFMDDFGTGYSSLSYLHRLPLNALKIDRSFVGQMERGDQHSQLVSTIVHLARSVDIGVVAEGVSTPEQLGILRELGCDLAQGFLFSPPLPAAEARAMLHREPRW